MGTLLSQEPTYVTRTTRFTEGEYDLVLWFPQNLHCIFLSNYEDEVLSSLSEIKGWGPNGDRFNVVHYYPLKTASGPYFSFTPTGDVAMKRYNQIKKYNDVIHKALTTLNGRLSREEKRFLKLEMILPRLLISTFEPTIATENVSNEDLLHHILSKLDRFILLETELKQKIEKVLKTVMFMS